MTAKQICALVWALAWLLTASAVCRAQAAGSSSLTAAEYRAELDRLSSATQQLDSSGSAAPQPLHDVPQSWRVRTEQGEFEISAEGLRRDVRRYESEKNVTTATTIRARIESLRHDLDGYEKPAADFSAERAELDKILAGREFGDVHGPTWIDRLKQDLTLLTFRLLERVFRSTAIPTIGKFFVYGLMGLAVLALGYFVYRTIAWGTDVQTVTPTDLPVSAKEWTIWLAEARASAAQGKWRDAIHLAYWAGISFLERQGMWKPDRARTPREYLRLLGSTSEHRDTLSTLTHIFELAWYAKRDASERTFSQTLAALEKLGCR
jgi:hypothetical protein